MKTLTAAIQFGSFRICAAAAKINEDGSYEVCAIESESSAGCLQHGCVVNVAETAQHIKTLMQKLSNRVMSNGFGSLQSAYIGLCGMSMHSVDYQPTVMVGPNPVITDEVKQQLEQQSRSLNLAGKDILGVRCNGYAVEGESVRAFHQLIVADNRLLMGVQQAMARVNVKVAGFMATPLTTADILTQEELQKGCLLLDFGAQLITISIYKDSQLRFLNVLPLGSECVTRDIATLGLRLEEAEELKLSWSDLAANPLDRQMAQQMACPVDYKRLGTVVLSRYEELAANIAHQIEVSGYQGQLEGGCVLTGGASLQKGLTTLLSNKLDIRHISTRSCNSLRFASSERKPHLASLMTMLPYCRVSCEMPKPVEVPKPAFESVKQVEPKIEDVSKSQPELAGVGSNSGRRGKVGLKGHMADFFGDLFSGLDQ